MRNNKLKIVYEDKHMIIVNKPSNMLTIKTNKKDKCLYNDVFEYLHKKNQKVFIVHRLDKDTSGLIIFAKSEKVKKMLQDNWNQVVRNYLSVVHGKTKKSGVIESYINENKSLYSYSSKDKKGKYSKTCYKLLNNNKDFSLIEINIITGRKNQIRVHMKDNNTPIVGDKKYGLKDDYNTMYLLAYKLEFIHPITNKKLIFELDIPKEYINLTK